jgi:hypothetical protein
MRTAAAPEGRALSLSKGLLRMSIYLAAWTAWLVVIALFWVVMLLDGGPWFVAAAIGFTVFTFAALLAVSCCAVSGLADEAAEEADLCDAS